MKKKAIHVVQFVRNQALRLWMDRRGTSKNDLCVDPGSSPLSAARMNSQARQAAASRAWLAIEWFYESSEQHKQGSKGYPSFQPVCLHLHVAVVVLEARSGRQAPHLHR